ncbi:hypothetical protein RB620_27835 [Paenibacillus sp. LHD-117]|uniref:hypothetical protein n=1 Tax=Paenibacillus sp. LHD-117 TaxID=3071412 RepID=UPI0027E1B80E|nr:hypothetical protein [Paenibacillus sp. LHD-117]MDQ6423245.1 hypothetical protein [Paenibacillus sp. LHD-117]
MSKQLGTGLAAILLFLWLVPAHASAYSYGDANTEDVAETFKAIVSALSGDQPDWKTALETHRVRRSEIQSHFGESVALTLDKNAEAKDGKLLIANYKAVLVMNLDRRFTYALKDVGDYAAAKLLLAKAKATFDTLSPYMASGTDDINQAFDDALEALGNPGLFGVGKKEADPETFEQKVKFIYDKVKPGFPYKAYVKPAATATNEAKPTKEPASSQKPVPSKSPGASQKPVATAEPLASESSEETPSATPGAEPSQSPEGSATASPEESSAADGAGMEASPPAEPGGGTSVEGEADAPALAASSEDGAQTEGHAPMERADRTNPYVTIFVIAGVAAAGGGTVWFIRRKGLL